MKRPRTAPHPDAPLIRLTSDELMCVLGAVVMNLANPGPIEDEEDRRTLLQTRSAADKLRRAAGMDLDTFALFCVRAAGAPAEGVVKVLEEEIAREDARRRRLP